MTDEEKKLIDSMDYEALLRRWRYAKIGEDTLFRGETGTYFAKVMFEKKDKLSPGEQVAASKRVGWEE